MIQTPLRHRKGMRVTHWRRVSGRRRRQQAYVSPSRLSARRIARRVPTNKTLPQHRHPITRAELTHLSRRADQRRRPVVKLVYIAFSASVVLSVLLGLIPKSGNQMTATMRDTYVLLSNVLQIINLTLLALSFMAQIVLTGQALLLASDTVTREKAGGTWDLLLITGQSAGQIIIGKWWAVQIHLYRHYTTLIILRACVFAWLGITSVRSGGLLFVTPRLPSLFVAPVLVFTYTFLDIALAAAVGVAASVRLRRGIAYTTALALFFICVFGFAGAQVLLQRLAGFYEFGLLPRMLLPMLVTPIDSGYFLALYLLNQLNASIWGEFAIGVCFMLLTFTVLIGGLLWLARRLADPRMSQKTQRPR